METKRFTVRLPAELYEELRRYAFDQELPKSEVIRRFTEAGLGADAKRDDRATEDAT